MATRAGLCLRICFLREWTNKQKREAFNLWSDKKLLCKSNYLMINNAKQICPNSFRISTFGYKANISNNRERWIMMKIFIGGKTTISSSPTNTKGRHFSKNHCTKQGEESKTAFSRFHILNNRCVWFLSSLPQREINKDQ